MNKKFFKKIVAAILRFACIVDLILICAEPKALDNDWFYLELCLIAALPLMAHMADRLSPLKTINY